MKKTAVRLLCLFMSVFFTASIFSSCAVRRENVITISNNGKSDYSIVIADNAGDPEKNAAAELQKYINLISGTTLEIKTDAEPETTNEFVLGRTNRGLYDINYEELGTDGYAVKAVDGKIVIAGEPRGVIYGVYGFLRDELGCGFYAADCEYVPSKPLLQIPENTNRIDVPVFEDRWAYWDFYYKTDSASAMKLGLNPVTEEWGSMSKIHASNMSMHTINYLLTGNEDPKEHTYNQQPCVSSDENYNKILQHALEWIQRQIDTYGRCDILDVSQNDGPGGWCTCDKCTELNNTYGNGLPTGSWWYFINRIATDVRAVYPNIEIVTYAYEDTRPPVTLDIVDGVSAFVGTGNGGGNCVIHGFEKCKKNMNSSFVEALNSWGDKLENIYIYEYLGCSSEFNMTNPDFYAMHDNFMLYADKGAYSVTCFATTDVAADLVALRYYLMSRLSWNPYMTDEEYNELITDFCMNYYGAESGVYVKKFIDLVIETFEDAHPSIYYGYDLRTSFPSKIYDTDHLIYPEITEEMVNDEDFDWTSIFELKYFADTTYIDKAHALFEEAERLAEDDEKRERIELAHIQVLYYEVYVFESVYYSYRPWTKTINEMFGKPLVNATTGIMKYMQMGQELWQEMKDHGITRITERVDMVNDPKLEYTPKNWHL